MTTTLPPDDQEARTQRHLACLDILIAQGMDLANRVHQQAPEAAPVTPETLALFNKINLTVRRAILLSRKLAEPLPPAPAKGGPPLDRTAIRKRIIREVEDTIHRQADPAEAEILRAELCERVETCDFDDDIGTRPTHEIILDICRDLGTSSDFPANRFKRRTPQEIRTLNARAAAPRPPGPATKNGPAAPKSTHPPPQLTAPLP